MKTSEKLKLVESISTAWATVPYPGDQNIFTPDSYDNEGNTEYFSGTTWKGHKVERLRARSSAINVFFTPRAYH